MRGPDFWTDARRRADVQACRKDGACGEAPLPVHTWRARNDGGRARRHKVWPHMHVLHSGRIGLQRGGQLTGSPPPMMDFGRRVLSILVRSAQMREASLFIWPRPH